MLLSRPAFANIQKIYGLKSSKNAAVYVTVETKQVLRMMIAYVPLQVIRMLIAHVPLPFANVGHPSAELMLSSHVKVIGGDSLYSKNIIWQKSEKV